MVVATTKSEGQNEGEATVDAFRQALGPFVVAAERTRMPMVFTSANAPHDVVFANDAFLALTGYEREDVLARNVESFVSSAIDADTTAIVDVAFPDEPHSQREIQYRRKNGTLFWACVFVSPVCDENGVVQQQFMSFIDLTRHREENARCKMLIDELNHRVKNTLSTVQSIVAQALRRPAEPDAIREAIESRILALSRSHDLLTSGKWEGAGLHDLVVIAMHPFEAVTGLAPRFAIVGDNIHLSTRTTLSLAIALHELATNAVKYGALSNAAGTIAIDWALTAGGAGNRLVLRWQERDGPTVTPPTRKGFGSWVIECGLAHELGGEVQLDYLRRGVVCTIDIPAAAASGDV